MASRSTKWRNRQRIQEFFNERPILIDVQAFSNDHEYANQPIYLHFLHVVVFCF